MKSKPSILLSNDDGIHAAGLQACLQALQSIAMVLLVVPDRDRSGAASSLTLSAPISVKQLSDSTWLVQGTPADCVHLALTGLLPCRPDAIISGINHGMNCGSDLWYSGTVAAAAEGVAFSIPSMAISLAGGDADSDYSHAAAWVKNFIPHWLSGFSEQAPFLNVNVPLCYQANNLDYELTCCGQRGPALPYHPHVDPRGVSRYWIGRSGPPKFIEGSDFWAVEQGRVSVTPLTLDLTDRHQLCILKEGG